MVSLYDILSKKKTFSHIKSGVKTLDEVVSSSFGSGIYDFQGVPQCSGMYTVIGLMIISHLKEDENNQVVVVNTVNEFCWTAITRQEGFQTQWLDERLEAYTAESVSQLICLLERFAVEPRGSRILILNDFHALVEAYKWELLASYEEAILKHRIVQNSLLIKNHEKMKAEGYIPRLPQLPYQSALLKENPNLKYHSHILFLMNMISRFVFNNNLMAFLVGHLTSRYRKMFYRTQPSFDSSSDSQTPVSSSSDNSFTLGQDYKLKYYGKMTLSLSLSDDSEGLSSRSYSSTLDSLITFRIIFYKDWYHKTSHFARNYRPGASNNPLELSREELKRVFAVKLIEPSPNLEVGPFFFDYDQGYYNEDNSESGTSRDLDHISLIDLGEENSFAGAPLMLYSNTEIEEPELFSDDISLTRTSGQSEALCHQNSSPVYQGVSLLNISALESQSSAFTSYDHRLNVIEDNTGESAASECLNNGLDEEIQASDIELLGETSILS